MVLLTQYQDIAELSVKIEFLTLLFLEKIIDL